MIDLCGKTFDEFFHLDAEEEPKKEEKKRVFAIRVKETFAKTFLVEAESLEKAKELTQKSYDEERITIDDFDEYVIEKSPYATPEGFATSQQLENCETLP